LSLMQKGNLFLTSEKERNKQGEREKEEFK
jgi:hypothetical protein